MGAVASLVWACDALSPDVVVGERVDSPRPEAPVETPPHVWQPADPLPDPIEGARPSTYEGPDLNLQLVDVQRLPATWVPGHSASIAITVANTGRDVSPSTSIRLSLITRDPWVDDLEIDTLILDRIEGGEVRVVEAAVRLPEWAPSASFAFEAHVDPDDVVPESIERDNVWFGQVVDVSALVVEPRRIDFGPAQIGCGEARALTVENRSADRVILASLSLEGRDGPFHVRGARLPRTLAPRDEPGSRLEFEVSFDPSVERSEQAQLRLLTSQHRSQPTWIPVTGDGQIAPLAHDRFRQWFGPRVDFLLVVDRAPPMASELDELIDYVDIWVGTLAAQNMEYQIGVTLADVETTGGALVGPVVSSESQHPGDDLRSVLRSIVIDEEASGDGLAAARQSLTHHRHWLRPDAALSVIFSSNRDDTGDGEALDAVRAIVGAKQAAHAVTANAIILDGSARCGDQPPARRYIDVVMSLGGRLDPICDRDAYESLWALPHPGFGLRHRFELDRRPRPSTLAVRVNGVVKPAIDARGRDVWRTDRWSRLITFEPTLTPPAGATIDFEYVPECDR